MEHKKIVVLPHFRLPTSYDRVPDAYVFQTKIRQALRLLLLLFTYFLTNKFLNDIKIRRIVFNTLTFQEKKNLF